MNEATVSRAVDPATLQGDVTRRRFLLRGAWGLFWFMTGSAVVVDGGFGSGLPPNS